MQQQRQLETTLQTDLPQADLSNDDVAILYDIVTKSVRLPEADQFTFRALFSSYELVLTERGIDPDHDHVYFRFLLRLGGVPGHGSIYEKFIGLLDELGIQLEIVGDENTKNERDGAFEIERLNVSEHASALPTAVESDPPRPAPKRRASDSVYDLTTQGVVTNLRNGDGLPMQEDESRPQSAHGQTAVEQRKMQVDAGAKAQYRKESLEREIAALRKAKQAKRAFQSLGQPRDESENEPLLPAAQSHLSRLYEAFVNEQAERLVGSLFDRWRVRLHVHYHKYRRLRQVAEKFDRQVLLRQAWDRLRSKATPIEKGRTLKHYALEEQRANDARDRFLLTKAFTHWAKLTFDQRHRTGEARNIVIKGRLFNTWREMTAMNAENVRLFTLKCFLQRWRLRRINNLELEYEAVVHYEDALRQRIYQEWFWSFCSGRAPVWRDGKLIIRYARHWIEICRALKEKATQAERHYTRTFMKRLLLAWREKHLRFTNADADAGRRYQKHLQRDLLADIKAEAVLAPAARAVITTVDKRVSRTALTTWHQKATQFRTGEHLAEQHFQRNTFSKLREGYAYHMVRCRANERIANDALYKWILAERGALLQRHVDRKQMGHLLDFLKFHINEYNSLLESLRQKFVDKSYSRLKKSVFHVWRTRLANANAQEQQASKYELSHGGSNAFKLLIAQHDDHMKLDEWATLSNYYLTCKKMLRRWREETFEKQREKRRRAYLAVKRMLKINLAAKTVKSWHKQTVHLGDMDAQAEQFYEAHLDRLCIRAFETWLSLSRSRQTDIARAEAKNHRSLLSSCFKSLKANHSMIFTTESESEQLYSAKVVRLGSTLLRKWSMKALALQGLEQPSSLLRARYERAHFRAIFEHWKYQASIRWQQDQYQRHLQAGSGQEVVLSSSIGSTGSSSIGDNQPTLGFSASTMLDREDWIPSSSRGPPTISTVGTTVTAPSTTNTPTTFQQAGYLSTPSRRAARARAAVKLSSQTATASRELIATLNQSQSQRAMKTTISSLVQPPRPSSIPLPVPPLRVQPFALSGSSHIPGFEEGHSQIKPLHHLELEKPFGPPLQLLSSVQRNERQEPTFSGRDKSPAIFDDRAQSTTPKGSPLPPRTVFNFQDFVSPSPALTPPSSASRDSAREGNAIGDGISVAAMASGEFTPPVWPAGSQSLSLSSNQPRAPLFARSRRNLELRKKLFATSAAAFPSPTTLERQNQEQPDDSTSIATGRTKPKFGVIGGGDGDGDEGDIEDV